MENYPMRINKYLALKGISTRRGADVLIESGKVFINGKKAKLGDKVGESDKVDVKGLEKQKYVYFAYNKPIGVQTEDIIERMPKLKTAGVFPVGRIDKASHGLMLLTNDGRITDRLLNPKFEHEKGYDVRVKGHLRSSFKDKMEKGVNIEGYQTKPCKVEILDVDKFRVTLTEGKKHQIRRMCVALFQEVAELKRIRVMNIKLGDLKQNQTREITGTELEKFLSLLQL